jgi:hypothetical protein
LSSFSFHSSQFLFQIGNSPRLDSSSSPPSRSEMESTPLALEDTIIRIPLIGSVPMGWDEMGCEGQQ